jgi:hypothetical protein
LTLAPAKADPVKAREAIPTPAVWAIFFMSKAAATTRVARAGLATVALAKEVFIIEVCIVIRSSCRAFIFTSL